VEEAEAAGHNLPVRNREVLEEVLDWESQSSRSNSRHPLIIQPGDPYIFINHCVNGRLVKSCRNAMGTHSMRTVEWDRDT